MRPIRILLADDHALFREGVRSLLQGHADLQIVGEVENGQQAVEEVRKQAPDVVLMDIAMPVLDGIEATRRIRQESESVKVLILTMHDNEEIFLKAIAAGASGYVLKRAKGIELMFAIRSIHEGNSYLSPFMANALMQDYMQRAERLDGNRDETLVLSQREAQILRMIAEGQSGREIAQALQLSVKTVHNHRARLMAKLNIHRSAELVKYAIRKGLVEVH